MLYAEENFSGADYLLNATQRPVDDFLVNTVPFFRGLYKPKYGWYWC